MLPTDPQTAQTDLRTLSALTNLIHLPEQGTVFTAQVHKVGEQHQHTTYGDDVVQVLIWTGFSHRALIQRSMRILDYQLTKGGYIEKVARATLEEHGDTTIEDVCHALQEIRDWFRRYLRTDDMGNAPWPETAWPPLEIEGTRVRGCTVYRGPARPEDPHAPVPGIIYVKGLKLGERIIQPAPNGRWRADSSPKTIAKNIIKESLPVGLYCQYRLDMARVSGIAVAAEAVEVARAQQIPIDPGALTSLFKVA